MYILLFSGFPALLDLPKGDWSKIAPLGPDVWRAKIQPFSSCNNCLATKTFRAQLRHYVPRLPQHSPRLSISKPFGSNPMFFL